MALSGVTATVKDGVWLKSCALEYTIFQPEAGSIVAYYRPIWRVELGIKYGLISAFATTSGTLMPCASIGVIKTGPNTIIDTATDLVGFSGTSYIDVNTCGSVNNLTGSGDESVIVTHQGALEMIEFGNPGTVLHTWPDTLTVDSTYGVIEGYDGGAGYYGWVLSDYTPTTELIYNVQTNSYFKRIQHALTIKRNFVAMQTFSPASGSFIDVLPDLKSEKGTAVTVGLGFLPTGMGMYIDSDTVEISDPLTGEGAETVQLLYLAPDVGA